MSLNHPERIDALVFRDGYARILIHHFDTWEPVEERTFALSTQLATVADHLRKPAVRARLHNMPLAVELHCTESAPEEIRALCHSQGVLLLGPSEP